MHLHPGRHGVHIANAPHHRSGVVSRHRLPHLTATEEPTLVKREPAPAETGPKNTEKASSSTKTATLPVVLGAVVPIVVAIVILLFLHRRHVKKLRNEDANDKHKSLDFGMDIVEPSSRRNPMRETEKPFPPAHTKGISLDVGPYLVPPGLHSSRDSLHSMSMSVDDDGKYRPANTYFQNDGASIRSYPRGPQDDALSLAGSTNRLGLGDDMDQGLLGNAQRMSRSSPPLYNMPPTDRNAQSPPDHGQVNPGFQLDLPRSSSPFMPFDQNDGQPSGISGAGPGLHMDSRAEEPHGYPLQDSRAPYPESAHAQTASDNAQPPSIQPPRISLPESDVMSDPADNRKSTFIVPDVNVSEVEHVQEHGGVRDTIKPPEEPSQRDTLAIDTRRDTRRMTLGLRPLPPDDPSDNPEQRANRIRSFYKEYFDESKPGRETQYYEDYGPEMYDSVIYDDYYNPPLLHAPSPSLSPVVL
ncbi:hypothetical protein PHISP_00801 [Aspergillus sp. HF37]|nr:hypothetical protein PHISP_00801 [Aspergillus sp. HF37]